MFDATKIYELKEMVLFSATILNASGLETVSVNVNLVEVLQQKHVHSAQGASYPDVDESCPPLEN